MTALASALRPMGSCFSQGCHVERVSLFDQKEFGINSTSPSVTYVIELKCYLCKWRTAALLPPPFNFAQCEYFQLYPSIFHVHPLRHLFKVFSPPQLQLLWIFCKWSNITYSRCKVCLSYFVAQHLPKSIGCNITFLNRPELIGSATKMSEIKFNSLSHIPLKIIPVPSFNSVMPVSE